MHALLLRQLKRLGIDGKPPDAEQWRALLDRLSRTYEEVDQDRYTLERSLSISSREVHELYEDLRRSSETALAMERNKLAAANLLLHEQMQQLQAAQSQIFQSAKLAALGEIAAGIVHEINNPIGAVLSNLTFIGQTLPELAGGAAEQRAEVQGAVDDAEEAAGRIRDIVADMRLVSRAEPAESHLPFDVNQAIRMALRMARPQLQARAMVESRLGTETNITGHVGRMSQVFINLLVNAAQAMGARPAERNRLVVRSWRVEGRVFAEVADNGPGMSPDIQARIFEPFFTTKAPGEGTGLGLSVTREIIRRHGGDITVTSTAGSGTVFTIELPGLQASAIPGSREHSAA